MYAFLTLLHVLIAALLVVVILLQSGRGGGLAGTFGGGSMGTMLGVRGTVTFLTKATVVLAAAFMISCVLHASISHKANPERSSAVQRELEHKGTPVLPFRAPAGVPQGGGK